MTEKIRFPWDSRESVADALLDYLDRTPKMLPLRGAPCRSTVSRLMVILSTSRHVPALRLLALDREEDPWVRRDALRALRQFGGELTAEELGSLLADEALYRTGPLLLLLCFATDAERQRVALAHLDAAGTEAQESVLINIRTRAGIDLSEPLIDALYQRWIDRLGLDPETDVEVARATCDRPRSVEVVLSAKGPLDLRRLLHLHRLSTPEEVAEWFQAYPARLEEALDALIFPLAVLSRYRTKVELIDRATHLIVSTLSDASSVPVIAAVSVLLELGRSDLLELDLERDDLDPKYRRLVRLLVLGRLDAETLADQAQAIEPGDGAGLRALFDRLGDISKAPAEADLPILRWALECWHPGLRAMAIDVLDRLKVLTTEQLRAISRDDPRVEMSVLGVLAKKDDELAIADLRRRAIESDDVCLRAEAIHWLVRCDPPTHREILRRAVETDHETYQTWYAAAAEEAAIGLSLDGSPPALEALAHGLLAITIDDTSFFVEQMLEEALEGEDERRDPDRWRMTWRRLWLES